MSTFTRNTPQRKAKPTARKTGRLIGRRADVAARTDDLIGSVAATAKARRTVDVNIARLDAVIDAARSAGRDLTVVALYPAQLHSLRRTGRLPEGRYRGIPVRVVRPGNHLSCNDPSDHNWQP